MILDAEFDLSQHYKTRHKHTVFSPTQNVQGPLDFDGKQACYLATIVYFYKLRDRLKLFPVVIDKPKIYETQNFP